MSWKATQISQSGDRRLCDAARIKKVGAIADLIKEFDDHDHPVGVHHNIGDPMAFPDHPAVDIYVQQANVIPTQGRGNLTNMHAAGQPGSGFDPQHRYNYTMGEGYNWHPQLVAAGDRTMLRKSYYATAMSGGYVTVLGMFTKIEKPGADPSNAMLRDMRKMQMFFESIPFNRMSPCDELRSGGTDWILADTEHNRFLLYSHDEADALGVRSIESGRYTLRWSDPANGNEEILSNVDVTGDTRFEKPRTIGSEAVLYIAPSMPGD